MRQGGFKPPVNEGQEIELEIMSKGAKGDPIGKVDGYTIFVQGDVNIGEKVNVRITKTLDKFGFAEIIGDSEEVPEESEQENTEDFGEDESGTED